MPDRERETTIWGNKIYHYQEKKESNKIKFTFFTNYFYIWLLASAMKDNDMKKNREICNSR